MKVRLARTAGFCMGVRRAMDMVLTEARKEEGPLYTYGPLIHNHQVLDLLAAKNIHTVSDPAALKKGRIVVRAHGIPPKERQQLKATGLKMINATCPRVARVQSIIRSRTRRGQDAIIIGDRDHAEVIGLMGHSARPPHVIQSVEEVHVLPDLEKPFVVAQTTQNEKNYHAMVEALRERCPRVQVFDTICDATHQRQEEVRSFAGEVDAVVVVGGYHSGNTQRLVDVAREAGLTTFHVETEKELDTKLLAGMNVVGVTAGASTPNWMIKNVVLTIEEIRSRKETWVKRGLRKMIKFLVLNNLSTAIGAFSFCHAVGMLAGRDPGFSFSFLSFLYIYAMYVLNQFLDKGAGAYNDPERAAFLKKHKRLRIATGLAATAFSLLLAYLIGMATFISLSAISLLGVIYSIPIVPERIQRRYNYTKIEDIPGSRSLSEALAWVAVMGVLPLLERGVLSWPAALISILVLFLMAYSRTVLFDIFQLQGDLIVGTETLPILLGKRKTLKFIKILLICTGMLLFVSPMFKLSTLFCYFLFLSLIPLFLWVMAYEKRWFNPGIKLEAAVDANFVLAGLLALIWRLDPWPWSA